MIYNNGKVNLYVQKRGRNLFFLSPDPFVIAVFIFKLQLVRHKSNILSKNQYIIAVIWFWTLLVMLVIIVNISHTVARCRLKRHYTQYSTVGIQSISLNSIFNFSLSVFSNENNA